uniref:HMA domain-containing protein n=1 Tax=Davidia involucrata TaxID=16924 RepID=A0A5B7CAQ1_DAVIN
MKQKVVIKVSMNGQKSRSKAMKIAVGVSGVESAALQGQDKSQIEVTGDGVDAVALTTLLRKNVGYAELVSVSQVGEKKEGEKKQDPKKDDPKKNEATVHPPVVWTTSNPYGVYQIQEFRDPNYENNCSIM